MSNPLSGVVGETMKADDTDVIHNSEGEQMSNTSAGILNFRADELHEMSGRASWLRDPLRRIESAVRGVARTLSEPQVQPDDLHDMVELLRLGIDESDGWATHHLERATALVAKYEAAANA